MMESMKKTIILAIALLAGCSSMQAVKHGSVEMEIPSGWVAGVSGYSDKSVSVTIYTKSAGNSIESVVSQIEQTISRPSITPNSDSTLTLSGETSLFHPAVFVETDHISLSCRDLEVEMRRIEKTDRSSNVSALDMAKVNVIENALLLEDGFQKGLMPTDEQIKSSMVFDFAQAQKAGSSKERFLANWGITEDEFRVITTVKLLFKSLIDSAAKDAKSDGEYARLATAYRNDLPKKFRHKVFNPESKKVTVIIRDVGDAIIAVTGYGEGFDLAMMARSVKITGNPIDGEVFLAGRSD
jgi:hypothetical protein